MSQPSGFGPMVNTAAFDVTGDPGISVPSRWHDRLPLGTVRVGRHWAETTRCHVAGVVDED